MEMAGEAWCTWLGLCIAVPASVRGKKGPLLHRDISKLCLCENPELGTAGFGKEIRCGCSFLGSPSRRTSMCGSNRNCSWRRPGRGCFLRYFRGRASGAPSFKSENLGAGPALSSGRACLLLGDEGWGN